MSKKLKSRNVKADYLAKSKHNRKYSKNVSPASERENLVIWRSPLKTLRYFIKEVYYNLCDYYDKCFEYRKTLVGILLIILSIFLLAHIQGPHQHYLKIFYKKATWSLYWVFLGILSSVGLGTGLHTFLLYLGPHIASVTLAAYECGSLNFPEPPYPDEIVCPESINTAWQTSIWNIMSKVRLEAMMWGAGTALGELPPYFMARAARMSGHESDTEDELLEINRKKNKKVEKLTLFDKGKLLIEKLVVRVGFLGILACASVPNPLFDLAGITCGHFLVPFWTFFGASLIGKAVIKMHLQKMFVIIAFNENLVESAVSALKYLPIVGPHLQVPFKDFLEKQKLKFHKGSNKNIGAERNILSTVFEIFVTAMIIYFVVSIINSLAQSYHKRQYKRSKEKVRDKRGKQIEDQE